MASTPDTISTEKRDFSNLQALVVAGGYNYDWVQISSVLTLLLPDATAWTPLASLPRTLIYAQASIVGGKLRVNGGLEDNFLHRTEVMEIYIY